MHPQREQQIKMVLGGGGEKLSYYNGLHEGLYEET